MLCCVLSITKHHLFRERSGARTGPRVLLNNDMLENRTSMMTAKSFDFSSIVNICKGIKLFPKIVTLFLGSRSGSKTEKDTASLLFRSRSSLQLYMYPGIYLVCIQINIYEEPSLFHKIRVRKNTYTTR